MSDTDKQDKTDTDIEEMPKDDESENTDSENTKPVSTEDDPTVELLKKIDDLQEQVQSNKDDALRHRAELENFRKRMQRDKDSLRKVAAAGVIEEMLGVLDNLKLGLKSAEKHPEAKVVVEGFQMVASQLQTVLGAHGLKELSPSGDCFDPNFHECVSHQISDDVPEDHVLEVVRSGYTLNERLLRPAHVIVSHGKVKKEDAKEKEDSESSTPSTSEDPGI